MTKKWTIGAFIVILIAILVLPFVVNIGRAGGDPEVSLDTPQINAMPVKECIAPTDYMRESHMVLLNEWRDAVVRDGNYEYVSSSGQVYEMSLDETCLGCHSNQEDFCDKCHEYASVDLYCWDCHGLVDADNPEATILTSDDVVMKERP